MCINVVCSKICGHKFSLDIITLTRGGLTLLISREDKDPRIFMPSLMNMLAETRATDD